MNIDEKYASYLFSLTINYNFYLLPLGAWETAVSATVNNQSHRYFHIPSQRMQIYPKIVPTIYFYDSEVTS